MTNALKSKIAKAGLGLLVGAMMLVAPSANALTMAEAQTLITILGLQGAQAQAVLALATGNNNNGGPGLCYQFTTLTKVGTTSEEVRQLQMVLNQTPATALAVAAGANGSAGHETTYFGPATANAVVRFQQAHGIAPTAPQVGPMTRAALNAMCVPGNGGNNNGGNNNGGNQNGPVTAMLATDNPGAGTLVASQATADLAHFTFSGSGTVSSMTFQRTGVSNNTVFDNVYLYEGNTRITDSASVNNAGVIMFNNLNWMVNGTRTVSVRADINANAGSQTVGVALTGYNNGSAQTANLQGNVMNVVANNGIVGTVNIGTQTVASANVDAGATQYTFWSAPVTVNTHSMWLKSLALRFIGSAPTDALANVKLYVDGTAVATASGVNQLGYMTFDFGTNALSLNTGSHTFDVRADIQKGSARTVQLTLQNRADMMVTDSQAMVNVGVCSVSCGTVNATFSAVAGGTISINAGSVSVVVDPTFQSATNVTGGATNVVIGKYKLHAYGEDVKVQSLQVTPFFTGTATLSDNSTCNGTTNCTLNNVSLYFNGSQVGSSQNLNQATAATLTFQLGSSLVVPAGTDSYLEVRADMMNSANLGYKSGTIKTTLEGDVNMNNGQGMNSLDATIDVPGSDTTTPGLSTQNGLIAIAQNTNYASPQSISPSTSNAKIGSFIVQNQSTSESVRVTNLRVTLTLTTLASSNYANLRTSETSGSGATPINPATAAAGNDSVNNFPVDFTLAPGATKTIDVLADLNSGTASPAVVTKLHITAVGMTSNVTLCSPALNTGSTNGCNNNGTNVTGQTINIASGTFNNGGTIVASSTQPQYIAAANGATDAAKMTLNFKSTNGTATISELKFLVAAGSGTVSSVRIGNTTAPVVSDVAYLTGLNIAVPNGGSGVNVDAFLTYAPVGIGGVTSGTESTVAMTYLRYTIGNTTTTLVGGQTVLSDNTQLTTQNLGAVPAAVGSTATLTFASNAGMQPGMVIVINNATDTVGVVQSLVGSTQAVVQTLFLGTADNAGTDVRFWGVLENPAYASAANNCPTIAVAGTTVAVGGTSKTDCMSVVGSKPALTMVDSSAALTPGLVKIGSVTVAADAKGDVMVNALPLSVTTTGAVTFTGGNLVVKNAADQSTITTTDGGLTVTANSTGTVTVTFTGGYTILAGQSVTFDIYATAATVTGGPAANTVTTTMGAAGSFLWTDVAGNANSTETGSLIYNYPTNQSVIND